MKNGVEKMAGKKISKTMKGKAVDRLSVRNRILLLTGLCLMIALILFVSYYPALSSNAICFDDDQYIVKNRLVQNPGWSSLEQVFTEVSRPSTVEGYYQPLTMTSLMLDYAMGGRANDLTLFHLHGLLLHVFNTLLIVILIYLLFKKVSAAVLTGLVFGIHPMTVETITWVGERKTLLAAFFSFIALIFYVLYINRSKKGLYWAALAAYFLALLSKPTCVLLPVVFLLLDVWPLKRFNRNVFKEKIPFFALMIVSSVITYVSQSNSGGTGTYSIYSTFLMICHNIVFYLNKMLWPVNLSSRYTFPQPFELTNTTVLIGVMGTVILAALLILSLKKTKAFTIGWMIFFVAILPTMGVVQFTGVIAADKYAYLPSIGFLILFAWLLCKGIDYIEKNKSIIKPVSIGILTVFILLFAAEIWGTRSYIADWKDSETLYRHMLSLRPKDYLLHLNMGSVLVSQKRIEEGVQQYQESIKLQPKEPKTYNSLGIAYMSKGMIKEAVDQFNKAIELNPGFFEAYSNLGSALASQKDFDAALLAFNKALKINDKIPQVYYNLGIIYALKGNSNQAIRYLSETVKLQPNLAEAHRMLGDLYDARGKTEEAQKEYRLALKYNPSLTDVREKLKNS